MLTRINGLVIVGALFVVSVVGCKSAQHHESNWANEVASNTVYEAPEPTSSYTLPAADEWVCPMHPRVKQSEPGKCSICGMDLVRSDDLQSGEQSSSHSGHSHSSGSEGSHSSGSGCGHCG